MATRAPARLRLEERGLWNKDLQKQTGLKGPRQVATATGRAEVSIAVGVAEASTTGHQQALAPQPGSSLQTSTPKAGNDRSGVL